MLMSYETMPQIEELERLCTFLKQVYQDLSEHEERRENAILFGSHTDLLDLRRDAGMRIVPVTRDDFKICSNARFVAYMQMFGIEKQERPS